MNAEMLRDKKYLGDGVYCGFYGLQLWIYLSNGITNHSFIALELEVMEELVRYITYIKRNIVKGASDGSV